MLNIVQYTNIDYKVLPNFTTIHRFISNSCHYHKAKPLNSSVRSNKYK
jgi:hypothetical protein